MSDTNAISLRGFLANALGAGTGVLELSPLEAEFFKRLIAAGVEVDASGNLTIRVSLSITNPNDNQGAERPIKIMQPNLTEPNMGGTVFFGKALSLLQSAFMGFELHTSDKSLSRTICGMYGNDDMLWWKPTSAGGGGGVQLYVDGSNFWADYLTNPPVNTDTANVAGHVGVFSPDASGRGVRFYTSGRVLFGTLTPDPATGRLIYTNSAAAAGGAFRATSTADNNGATRLAEFYQPNLSNGNLGGAVWFGKAAATAQAGYFGYTPNATAANAAILIGDFGSSGALLTLYHDGRVVANKALVPGAPVTVANLPSNPSEGMMVPVTDSNTAVWGAVVVGGGANHVLAYYNGTNWTVAAK